MDEDYIKELQNRIYNLNVKVSSLTKENEQLKEKLDEVEDELDDYKRCNKNLLRINKERENAKRGLYPKKEHSGYSLINSKPIDYRYKHKGEMCMEKLYQHAFQTPYDEDFGYYDAFNLADHDLTHEDVNGFSILKELGCKHYTNYKRYEELLDDEIKEIRENRYQELLEEYKKEHRYSANYEKEYELRDQANEEELYFFFNEEVYLDGLSGHWVVTLQSTCPLINIPKEIRRKKGDKDGKKDKKV